LRNTSDRSSEVLLASSLALRYPGYATSSLFEKILDSDMFLEISDDLISQIMLADYELPF
jgi:hypothetical protein